MVQQQIMLALHCKKTEAVDLKAPIKQYIADTYSPEQAHQADEDLEEIQGMRNQIAGMAGALPALRVVMLRYLAALSSIETRFPISKDAGHVKVSFLWYDAFRSTKKAEQVSIHFEKASILFNIGAVTSQIAVATDRTTDCGVKEASRLFQEAAGAFSVLRDASMKMDSPRPPDVSPETAAMLERLMLAQAQECVFEKVDADGKSPSLLARVAKQAAELYSEVVAALAQPPLTSHLDKTWATHGSVKVALFEAQAALCSGDAFRADDEIASEIARLKDAQKLLAAMKVGRGVSKELSDTLKAADENLSRRLKIAERENSAVYLQRIPPSSSLPEIKGVMLVKPVLPKAEGGSGGSGNVLFSSVIPDNSARALSRYSDMVDAMWRQQREKLDDASDDARLRLSQWELPEALLALDVSSPSSLPEGLRRELEEIEDCGGASFLHGLSRELQGLREVAGAALDRVEAELAAEAAEDGRLRAEHGATWNRPTSAALNRVLLEKAASYRANLKAAEESDARLQSRLAASEAEFSRLSIDMALSVMPRLQTPIVAVVEDDPATIVATLRQALDALTTLSAERAALEEALKGEKARDDVLPKIMASSDGHAELFARELSKYDALKADIAGNVDRQRQLLEVINSKQSAFRSAYNFSEWRAACKAAAAGVRSAVAAFQEVRSNLSEGALFYSSLQEAVSALRQHVGDFCLTRSIQREDMELEQRRREDTEAANLRAAQHMDRLSLGAGAAARGGGGNVPSFGLPLPPPPPTAPGMMPSVQHSGAQYQAPPPPRGGSYPPAYGGPAHPSYSQQPPPLPAQQHVGSSGGGFHGRLPPSGGNHSGTHNWPPHPYPPAQQQPGGYNSYQSPSRGDSMQHPSNGASSGGSSSSYSGPHNTSGWAPNAQPQQPWTLPSPPPPSGGGASSYGGTASQHHLHQQQQQQQQWSPHSGFSLPPSHTAPSPNYVPPPPPPSGHPAWD